MKTKLPQRARKSEDKAARRSCILAKSFELFQGRELESISMEALAKKVGLAKGTLYLYFKTKEEVFLEVMKQMLADWLHEVEVSFSKIENPLPAPEFSKQFVQTLKKHPELPRLLSQLNLILEKNISESVAFEFKKDLKMSLDAMAQLLQGKTPALTGPQNFDFLMKCYSLLVGLHPVCNPTARIQKVLQHPELQAFQLNFHEQLEQGISWLLWGLERAEHERENPIHFFNNY